MFFPITRGQIHWNIQRMGNGDLSGSGPFHECGSRVAVRHTAIEAGHRADNRSLSGRSGCVFLLADSWLGLLCVSSNIVRFDPIANRIDYRIDFQNRYDF